MRERDDAASHEPGAVLPGTRYLVDRRLGRGGMGTVYDTTHLETGERYAVKVLSTRFAGREDLEARMLREAAVLGSLESPNIVRVFDVGHLATDVPFYAMERLEGQTLRDVLRCRGPLAPSLACGLASQVLAALTVVHGAGLVHRDVKPENLFLRTDGTCVLLDFGLVKVLFDEGQFGPRAFPTGPGQLVGTCRYLPPEVFDDPCDRLAHLADIYAVGVVLVELLTGRLMLDGAPDSTYMTYLARHGFPRPYDQPPGPRVPDALRPVVEQATAREPGERYPSAAEFAAQLGWACQRGGFDLHAARPLPRPPAPPGPLRLVPRLVASSVVSGALVALAAAASTTWRPDPTADVHAVAEPRPAPPAAAPLSAPPALALPAAAPPAPASPAAAPPSTLAAPALPAAAPLSTPAAPALSAPPSAPPAPASPAPPVAASTSARPPRAPASAGRFARRDQLLAKLRSGQGTSAEAEQLAGLCRDLGDESCRRLALTFLERFGGSR